MTIEQRIKDELKRLSDQNSALYSTAHNLEERFQSLTDQVKDYLSKINSEMPEYDKHDASHSEAVLDIIEQGVDYAMQRANSKKPAAQQKGSQQ
jgi:predicted  nucleic acid-binding Zn-ribbon protein